MYLHITPSFNIDRLCKTASVLLFLVINRPCLRLHLFLSILGVALVPMRILWRGSNNKSLTVSGKHQWRWVMVVLLDEEMHLPPGQVPCSTAISEIKCILLCMTFICISQHREHIIMYSLWTSCFSDRCKERYTCKVRPQVTSFDISLRQSSAKTQTKCQKTSLMKLNT